MPSPVTRESFLPSIHADGWPFVGAAGLLTLVLMIIDGSLGWLGALTMAAVAFFFRDPQRVTPTRKQLVVSPADGIVVSVKAASPPPELETDGRFTRVSIFLSLLDVHVNRVPIGGTIIRQRYRRGTFVNALRNEASDQNERASLLIHTPDGQQISVVQIAGLLARRIRTFVVEGQVVLAGERLGLIRFGSRVDLYLPEGTGILVVAGQRAVGGETVIADLSSQEPSRYGERR